MPNRILRDCTDSEPVNSVSIHCERLFYRLIMKADDFGRQTASTKLLRPMLFPLLLDEVREADLQRQLQELEKAGLIRLYAVDGKPLLEITNFKQFPRSKVSKFPSPQVALQAHSTSTAIESRLRPYANAHSETETETEANTKAPADEPPWMVSPAFAESWREWEAHRTHKRAKLTPESIRRQRHKLASLGESAAVAAIQHSIEKGWTGLFEPTTSTAPSQNGQTERVQAMLREKRKREAQDVTDRD